MTIRPELARTRTDFLSHTASKNLLAASGPLVERTSPGNPHYISNRQRRVVCGPPIKVSTPIGMAIVIGGYRYAYGYGYRYGLQLWLWLLLSAGLSRRGLH